MRLVVNGGEQDFPDGTTISDLLRARGAPPAGVAVAVDGEVVPRKRWHSTVPAEGAGVEILTAVQGG